jgi:hypothetical protein
MLQLHSIKVFDMNLISPKGHRVVDVRKDFKEK